MSYLAPALDKNRQYIRYIVAYNWSAGPQALVLLGVLVLGATGFLPTGFTHLLGLVALIVLLVYHFFIVRIALEADTFAAIALVVGEFRSEEHTSELQSLMRISYAVFCLKKKKY